MGSLTEDDAVPKAIYMYRQEWRVLIVKWKAKVAHDIIDSTQFVLESKENKSWIVVCHENL